MESRTMRCWEDIVNIHPASPLLSWTSLLTFGVKSPSLELVGRIGSVAVCLPAFFSGGTSLIKLVSWSYGSTLGKGTNSRGRQAWWSHEFPHRAKAGRGGQDLPGSVGRRAGLCLDPLPHLLHPCSSSISMPLVIPSLLLDSPHYFCKDRGIFFFKQSLSLPDSRDVFRHNYYFEKNLEKLKLEVMPSVIMNKICKYTETQEMAHRG